MSENLPQQPARSAPVSTGKWILFGIGFFLLSYLYLPLFIFLLAAFIPYVAAFIIDQERERYASVCVAIGCACGILPPFIDLWHGDFTMETVILLLRSPMTWLIMTMSAAVGWTVYLIVPRLVSVAYKTWMEIKLMNLKKKQDALIETWGENIRSETISNNTNPTQ